MNVLIAGGSGFIGTALSKALQADGHRVWVLTRSPGRTRLPEGITPLRWDGKTTQGWLQVFEQADAVINLAGETIGRWPWSEAHKKRVRDSRINAGLAFTNAFQAVTRRPPVFIQASGVGYYGPCGPEPVTEDTPAGTDFLSSLALEWEFSTRLLDSLGVRRVIIRTGLVLDGHAGVLPLMALPVQLFTGGPLGTGKQGIPWIHITDEVAAIRFLLENDKARGAFNLTAPNPMSNDNFTRLLARSLDRPYWFPVPAFLLKTLLGEMSILLLEGQYAIPQRLVNMGYVFQYETASEAFRDLF